MEDLLRHIVVGEDISSAFLFFPSTWRHLCPLDLIIALVNPGKGWLPVWKSELVEARLAFFFSLSRIDLPMESTASLLHNAPHLTDHHPIFERPT